MLKSNLGKKALLSLFTAAALSTTASADSVQEQLEMLKKQIQMLEKQLNKQEKKIAKTSDKLNEVKAHDAGDNIKWDVDYRTQIDNVQYKHQSGAKSSNNALMTNRLWLGMKYQADENSIFRGLLSYNKAFGDTANHSQTNTQPGFANFDWLTNENATDNTVKVKEAFWLYQNDSFFGNKDVAWSASVGRRPSTDGIGINVRENQKPNSPLSHVVNVEFDGASLKFDLDKVTGINGMWLKFCGGRGLTNAKQRFQMDGTDYANDDTKNPNIDMLGFIASLYDDGQYSATMNYSKAWNLIGYTNAQIGAYQAAFGAATKPSEFMDAQANLSFQDVGDIEFATMIFKADGIGEGISDFLDETNFFASYAASKTLPNSKGMLGSTDSKTGNSIWFGVNMPDGMSKDGRFGLEWNKGSKYWRSFTYGEDTFAGSKIATRGTAWEAYYDKSLTKALSFHASYTHMKYDYTGSNSFFGAEGTPMTMAAAAMVPGNDPIKEAQDIKAYIRYRF